MSALGLNFWYHLWNTEWSFANIKNATSAINIFYARANVRMWSLRPCCIICMQRTTMRTITDYSLTPPNTTVIQLTTILWVFITHRMEQAPSLWSYTAPLFRCHKYCFSALHTLQDINILVPRQVGVSRRKEWVLRRSKIPVCLIIRETFDFDLYVRA